MKIGVVFPQTEFGNDIPALKDYTQTAEELGYSHILAYDHILGADPDRPEGWKGPYTHKDPFHEVFSLFSFMAAITSTIEFATGVLVLPQRETAVAAKQAAELDVLSEGRLRLGIGIGWNQVEFTALNQDFSNRGRRIEEQLEVMRKLWTEPLVNYAGKWHNIPNAGLNPMPVQQPIPVWFGGHHDNVLRRIGESGDGWMTNFRQADQAKPSLKKIAEFAQAAGRDPQEIGLEPRINFDDGDPKVWHNTLDDWREVNASHITLNTMYSDFSTPEKHIEAIKKFAEAVGLND